MSYSPTVVKSIQNISWTTGTGGAGNSTTVSAVNTAKTMIIPICTGAEGYRVITASLTNSTTLTVTKINNDATQALAFQLVEFY